MSMEQTYADRHKDDQSEVDKKQSYSKIQEPAGESTLYMSESKGRTLVNGGKPGMTLILNLIQSETCENWLQDQFLRRSGGLGVKIPKQLVSLDEKYLKRCMELMQMNAMKGAPCAQSVNLGSLNSEFMSNHATVGRRSSLDVTNCAIDYPMAVETGDSNISPGEEEIVGSIMESRSMMRILKSPLFQRLGILDHNGRLGGNNLFENKESIASGYQSSPNRTTSSISHEPGIESLALRNKGYQSDNVQRSPLSMSSGVPVIADQLCASSLSPSGSQGMLHFTRDNGIPHFTFSLDDQKEVYLAHALKVSNDKSLDYVYSFHLKSNAPKKFDISENELDTIGKMKVSTAFSLSSSNSRTLETQFVLVCASDNHAREMQPFSRNSRRSRKLSRVMDVFKAGHSFKQRTPSLFGGSSSSAIPEGFSPEKGLEVCCSSYSERKPDLTESDFLPNLELAAIVVKDHLQDENPQKKEVGGWGLKFLKKAVIKPSVASSEVVSASSESCLRNVDSSASMDIIVPAGLHGGPRMRNGGPSGLIERWRSGGKCDCGGWDIGCPLKVLKAKPRIEEGWPSSDAQQQDSKSFDIFTEGSTQGMTPPLKMVNIRDGLYFISFQPSYLSALQCFSIAVAIVHSQSPSLRPKHVHD